MKRIFLATLLVVSLSFICGSTSEAKNPAPSTTPPANADEYIPFDAGKTYTVMSGGSEEVVTVPSSYVLPYIVNGRDIRTGDIDGDGISENHQNTWYEGHTYTASNGVTIRIADGFVLIPGHGNVASVFTDGTENIEPNSSFMVAFHEYCGETKLKEISAADLPAVQTVSTNQTSINFNYPSFVTYKAAFDPLWSYQTSGNYNGLSCLQPINLNPDAQTTSGIGLLTTSAGLGYIWTMKYDATNGYWKLLIKSNMTELEWNSILKSLRMVTPDADAVFNVVYQDCYYGYPGLECEKGFISNWITLGNTQLRVDLTGNDIVYNIK